MKKVLWFLLLVSCGRSVPRASGAIYYVATTGNDGVTCMTATVSTTPKQHISQALNCLAAGDTLRIKAGTYTTQDDRIVDLYQQSQGRTLNGGTSDTNRTIITANPGDELLVILRPPDDATSRIVQLGNAGTPFSTSFITIQNIVIDGSVTGATNSYVIQAAVEINPGATNVNLVNCDVHNPHFNLVNAYADNTHVIGNKLHDTDPTNNGYAVYSNNAGIVIEKNTIFKVASYGIHYYGPSPGAGGAIIRNNTFYDNGDNSLNANYADVFLYSNNHQVYNNVFYYTVARVHNPDVAIIVKDGASGDQIVNNTIWGLEFGIDDRGNGSVVDNNHISQLGTFCSGGSPPSSCFGSPPYAIKVEGSGGTYGKNLCTATSTICAFASTAAMEFVTTTPGLSGFLHLKTGATGIANGLNLTGTIPPGSTCASPSTDKDGVARPCSANWDIGAYQFTTGGGGPPDTIPVDDFSYAVGSDLNTMNGGVNWTGPWAIVSGCAQPMLIAASMPGTFTAGNAIKSSSTSGFACYQRPFTEVGTGIIPWQMRNSVNNSGFRQVSVKDVGNTANAAVIAQQDDGHIHACPGYGNDTDLGTYNANQTYWMRMELNSSTNSGAYRISIDNGTFSSWINFCQTPPASQLGLFVLFDNPIATHDWWVDSIGAGPTMLAFTTQPPATVTTDVAFAANVSVTYSNGSTPVPGRTDSITLAVCPASPTATLSAASGVTKAAVNGTASWTDLVLSQPAGAVGVTLCATTTTMGITSATSNPITVNAAAPPLSEIASPPRVQARIR